MASSFVGCEFLISSRNHLCSGAPLCAFISGADGSLWLTSDWWDHTSALMHAITNDNIGALKLLVMFGEDVNAPSPTVRHTTQYHITPQRTLIPRRNAFTQQQHCS